VTVTPLADRPAQAGGVTVTIGDVIVNAGDDDWKAEAMRAFLKKLDDAERRILGAGRSRSRALGIN
jgi:hypothetical protein